MKVSITLDQKFVAGLSNIQKGVAELIANKAFEEFTELLFDAPQYSGNYVANMAIQTGQASGRKGGTEVFPEPASRREAARRGNLPAISHALNNNSDFVTRATRNIAQKAGWFAYITIYNKLPYAEEVEAMDVLRRENRGGEHAMAKAEARLNAYFSRPIQYYPW
jgi:hypothetical protein